MARLWRRSRATMRPSHSALCSTAKTPSATVSAWPMFCSEISIRIRKTRLPKSAHETLGIGDQASPASMPIPRCRSFSITARVRGPNAWSTGSKRDEPGPPARATAAYVPDRSARASGWHSTGQTRRARGCEVRRRARRSYGPVRSFAHTLDKVRNLTRSSYRAGAWHASCPGAWPGSLRPRRFISRDLVEWRGSAHARLSAGVALHAR